MLKRIGVLVAAGALCLMWVLADSAQAQCVVDTSTPTYANGQFLRYNPCDANGNVKVTGGGGGGGGGAVQSLTLASEITTNTTSTVVQGVSGSKTFWFELSGTGAVSVDMTIYGARTSNPTADELEVLCTYAGLAGTDKTVGTCNGASTTSYPYYVVGTANISGTNASVSVYAFY